VTSGRPCYAGSIPEGSRFISKPYAGPELIREIREVTAAAANTDS